MAGHAPAYDTSQFQEDFRKRPKIQFSAKESERAGILSKKLATQQHFSVFVC